MKPYECVLINYPVVPATPFVANQSPYSLLFLFAMQVNGSTGPMRRRYRRMRRRQWGRRWARCQSPSRGGRHPVGYGGGFASMWFPLLEQRVSKGYLKGSAIGHLKFLCCAMQATSRVSKAHIPMIVRPPPKKGPEKNPRPD